MKGVMLREPYIPVTVEQVDVDDPRADEVLLKTMATGVCHSDFHFVEGLWTMPMPCVLGHEGAGIVEKVGPGVDYVKPGDHVIACLSAFCGKCEYCMGGRPNLCHRTHAARSEDEPPRLSQNGGLIHQYTNLSTFAEQMLVHESSLVKVEDKSVPFEPMALIGCGTTTGLGAALRTARVEPGSTVAVLGCGGVGLSCMQGALIAGAGRIIAIDTVEEKLALARELGATDVVDASTGDTVAKVLALTGEGVDYSFEAIGTKRTAEQAYEMLKPGAVATVMGMIPQGQKVELDGPSLLRERRIQGSSMGSNRFRIDMPRYIEFYKQGRLKLDEMVTQRLPIEDINKAFDDMKNGRVARSVIMFD